MGLSIKLKIAAATVAMTLVLVVIGSAVHMHYVNAKFRELLGAEQLALVTRTADELDEEIEEAQDGLVKIAKGISPFMLRHPDLLEGDLARQPYLNRIFDEVLVRLPNGQDVIDIPNKGRRGTFARVLEHIDATVSTRKPQVSRPFAAPTTNAPFVSLTAPILGQDGSVIAVLIGAVNLTKTNMIGKIAGAKIGKSGRFTLLTLDRKVVVSSDSDRLLRWAVGPGAPQYLDHAMAASDGWEESIDSHGVLAICSYKRLHRVPWVLTAELPVAEAYAPIYESRRRRFVIAAALLLFLAPCLWLITNYLLSPLTRLRDSIRRLRQNPDGKEHVAIEAEDEIGELGAAFNELMSTRRRAVDTLKANEELMRSTFEQAAVGIAHVDAKTYRILIANRKFSDLLGYAPDQIVGIDTRTLTPADDLPARRGESAQLVAGTLETSMVERRMIRKDGTILWVTRNLSLVRDDAGQPKYFIAVIEDITARKQVEAAHATLEAQLRESQKMEAIGTLAGGVAHDFNNIIATILGNAELARQDADGNPAVLQSLERVRKAGSRARDLVQQILSFSRRQPTEFKLIGLETVVDESVRLLRATLPARLLLEPHCEPDVPLVRADATQIEQVLINLVTNAMQSIADRTGRIGIRLDTVALDAALAQAHPALRDLYERHLGRAVRLTVSDDGDGMDAATLQRIFAPFFTTRTGEDGTGLGLSVVHGIVKAHGGVIEVESRPGSGTRFTIFLPAVDGVAAASAVAAGAATPSATTAMGQDQHILYLDDDESLVMLVQQFLQRRGFRVSGFLRQDEALTALRAEPAAFDLVVTDYNMPGMSGLDVAREVRAIRADLPVAIASGFIDEKLQAQAAGAGVRDLIFKANVVEELCDAVQRLLPARH